MSERVEPTPDYATLCDHRDQWVVALATVRRDKILEIAESLAGRYAAEHREVPRAGLAMLRLRDSVLGEPFNLGELPLSSSRVVLTAPDGRSIQGAAAVMADDAKLATALAVCDAVLRERLDGWDAVGCMVEEGLNRLALESRKRRSILARSRVDFSLLSQD